MSGNTRRLIEKLVRDTRAGSDAEAVRIKARALINDFRAACGDEEKPTVDMLRSLCGIQLSGDPPALSEDAELVPDGSGGVEIRVNRDRPETRRNFSIAHEISHTFFPDYAKRSWCRTDARYRDRNNPDDRLEMLCDIGAAELLLPMPWFGSSARAVRSASGLLDLAAEYGASPEATLRRMAETSEEPMAAVYFAWKLKPIQKANTCAGQLGLFDDVDVQPQVQLRVDYCIPSPTLRSGPWHIPQDKSVASEGPLYLAATGSLAEGDCYLDLGPAAGRYHVLALPAWTASGDLGPCGERAVAAVLRPLDFAAPRASRRLL